MNSPVRNSGPVFPPHDLSSPVSQTSQTSSSSVSLNGPVINATAALSQDDEKDETAEDPFAGAPFSIPTGFRRASQKANRR